MIVRIPQSPRDDLDNKAHEEYFQNMVGCDAYAAVIATLSLVAILLVVVLLVVEAMRVPVVAK